MRKTKLVMLICLCLFLSSCGTYKESTQSFYTMNTIMEVTVFGDDCEQQAKLSREYIESLNRLLSVTDSESEIYKLNQTSDVTSSDETCDIVGKALEYCEKTQGALDISVYPLVRLWGFTTGEYYIPTQDEIKKTMLLCGYQKVKLEEDRIALEKGTQIDLGSVAKGYAAQKTCERLKQAGVKSALLYLGGNIQVIGAKPDGSDWNIGIKNPFDTQKIFASVKGKDIAVVTSGIYERCFEANSKLYHHIIDPSTGAPVENELVSISVISDDGFCADALSTALFVMGKEKALEFWRQNGGFEAIFVMRDKNVFITQGLKESFHEEDSQSGFSYEFIK